MKTIPKSLILKYQEATFRTTEKYRLKTPKQAVDFVNERGFIFFWPYTKIRFPNLWAAVAGDRPVPNEHDDPGHISWSWKDDLLDKRVWYYGRVIKKKNTMVSLETIPYFYALSPNYGDPEEDLREEYIQGLLPLEAKLIFEALINKGPLDTISLRKEAHLTSSTSETPFNRALDILQKQLKVLPVGISQAGAWKYAFKYDLTHRYFPELPEQARTISEKAARDYLVLQYFKSLGVSRLRSVSSFFDWSMDLTSSSIDRMIKAGHLVQDQNLENESEPFICISELVKS